MMRHLLSLHRRQLLLSLRGGPAAATAPIIISAKKTLPHPSLCHKLRYRSASSFSSSSSSKPNSNNYNSNHYNNRDEMPVKSEKKKWTSIIKDDADGLTLSYFLSQHKKSATPHGDEQDTNIGEQSHKDSTSSVIPISANYLGDEFYDQEKDIMMNRHPIIHRNSEADDDVTYYEKEWMHTLKFHIKTYGCQMNVNDTDIVRSILLNHHIGQVSSSGDGDASLGVPLQFIETEDEIQADVLLTNTCAIRENAEQRVWHRLRELRSHDRNFPLPSIDTDVNGGIELMKMTKERRKQMQMQTTPDRRGGRQRKKKRIIGVLGCMAERLKEDMFQDGTVDLVVGPDAYRDLPRLISVLSAPSTSSSDSGASMPTIPTERAVNVQLSLDETYASITPIRSNPSDVSAFVSIMRGCNNMCSYCVVPFTRGRERSRDMDSVVDETRRLLEEEGIREVILLGQNVNSYHDKSGFEKRKHKVVGDDGSYQTSNAGFSNMFHLRHGEGHRFADLLDAVSALDPELRVRFTSPHPKDYPPALLTLMAERPNICKHLHMPAQSGSTTVLERMRRGYSREAYLELIDDVRRLIPDVAISSDFITGFCGETEEEHLDTISLMDEVQFDQAFMFAYSMRGKTHAHRTMEDDVPADVKNRRLNEVITTFRREVQRRNDEVEVGRLRLVLVEGESKKSTPENRFFSGRTDQNKRVVFPFGSFATEEEVLTHLQSSELIVDNLSNESLVGGFIGNAMKTKVELSKGDYVVVQIEEARGHTLKGNALLRSSIAGFERLKRICGGCASSMPSSQALAKQLIS